MAATTVVNSPYDTLGNGGRKIVRLANGWLIAGARSSSTISTIYVYISKDKGATWTLLGYTSVIAGDFSLVSYGTNLVILFNNNNSGISLYKFDCATWILGTHISDTTATMQNLDTGQTAINKVSIATNTAGTELHAAWSSKNNSLTNSFNIRYAKGTIDVNGNVALGTVEQVTTQNTTGRNHTNPCIVISSNGIPIIIDEYVSSATYFIMRLKRDNSGDSTGMGSGWTSNNVYTGGYIQSNPCAVVDGNGVIHVVWNGFDSTEYSSYNIRYSKSSDGGSTWSSVTKLTSGNVSNMYQEYPTIGYDNNNNLYVLWQGMDSTVPGGYYQLRRKNFISGAWGAISTLTNNTTGHALYPSIIAKEANSIIGWIYRDNPSSSVKFDSITLNRPPTLTLTSPANNQTLVEGNTYTIAGNATEADSGNVVTVKYKIDNGTAYNITASVSNGTTPINFSKTLTYLNNRLYDGSNPVTPILAENVTHTLTVWAEDDQGGKSPDTTRNFTVLYNQPPQISGSDQDLGTITTPPSIQYTVTDVEGYSFTITEAVDGNTIRSFPGTDGKQETLTIPHDMWIKLQPGVTHQLTITATDQYNASSKRTYTFKRAVDGIELETTAILPADAQPTRVILSLNGTIPDGANLNVQVCNNAHDVSPTWEDMSQSVKNGRPYVFTNTTSTSGQWGIRFKISILPGG